MNANAPAMKRSLTLLTALCFLLIACENHAAPDPASGVEPDAYTHIPPAARQDILKTAQKLFKDATGCRRIERLEVSVKNIRMMFNKKILNGKALHPLPGGGFLLDEQEIPATGYVQENDETWLLTGCNAHREFTLKYFGDDKGITYYGVFDPEKHPAPEE